MLPEDIDDLEIGSGNTKNLSTPLWPQTSSILPPDNALFWQHSPTRSLPFLTKIRRDSGDEEQVRAITSVLECSWWGS
ncbi:hypothetical protein HBB16_17515 [Pseudonocardia sp. MCCB 268]|nr:hypothetical protein [Pseudonocardia cytotoxica]